jgi:hypothetical protein
MPEDILTPGVRCPEGKHWLSALHQFCDAPPQLGKHQKEQIKGQIVSYMTSKTKGLLL